MFQDKMIVCKDCGQEFTFCASCGVSCKGPFEPRNDRPVYCSDCFRR